MDRPPKITSAGSQTELSHLSAVNLTLSTNSAASTSQAGLGTQVSTVDRLPTPITSSLPSSVITPTDDNSHFKYSLKQYMSQKFSRPNYPSVKSNEKSSTVQNTQTVSEFRRPPSISMIKSCPASCPVSGNEIFVNPSILLNEQREYSGPATPIPRFPNGQNSTSTSFLITSDLLLRSSANKRKSRSQDCNCVNSRTPENRDEFIPCSKNIRRETYRELSKYNPLTRTDRPALNPNVKLRQTAKAPILAQAQTSSKSPIVSHSSSSLRSQFVDRATSPIKPKTRDIALSPIRLIEASTRRPQLRALDDESMLLPQAASIDFNKFRLLAPLQYSCSMCTVRKPTADEQATCPICRIRAVNKSV